jgi:hypothetical protein
MTARIYYWRGFTAGAIATGIAAAFMIAIPVQLWFTYIGYRDANAEQASARMAMIERCKGSIAWTIHYADRDESACSVGSNRMAQRSKK